MIFIGNIALWLALLLSTFAIFAPFANIIKKDEGFLRGAYYATYASAGLLTLSITVLAISFLTNNYRIQYVTEYSNKALHWVYKLSAVYAGQAGSLLFWGWLIAVFAAIVAFINRDVVSEFISYVI